MIKRKRRDCQPKKYLLGGGGSKIIWGNGGRGIISTLVFMDCHSPKTCRVSWWCVSVFM